MRAVLRLFHSIRRRASSRRVNRMNSTKADIIVSGYRGFTRGMPNDVNKATIIQGRVRVDERGHIVRDDRMTEEERLKDEKLRAKARIDSDFSDPEPQPSDPSAGGLADSTVQENTRSLNAEEEADDDIKFIQEMALGKDLTAALPGTCGSSRNAHASKEEVERAYGFKQPWDRPPEDIV